MSGGKDLESATERKYLLTYFVTVEGNELNLIWEMMEVNAGNAPSNCKQPSEHMKSVNHHGKKRAEKETKTSVFINHAAIAWHENRKKWVGDQSRRAKRMEKDPIISWTTSYEDLLSTNEPFAEPIPLPEMVDFLVDIWHDEGLFD